MELLGCTNAFATQDCSRRGSLSRKFTRSFVSWCELIPNFMPLHLCWQTIFMACSRLTLLYAEELHLLLQLLSNSESRLPWAVTAASHMLLFLGGMVFTAHTTWFSHMFLENTSTHGYTRLHCVNPVVFYSRILLFFLLHMCQASLSVYTWLRMATRPYFFWDHQLHDTWFSSLREEGGINVRHLIPIRFSNKAFNTDFKLVLLHFFLFSTKFLMWL